MDNNKWAILYSDTSVFELCETQTEAEGIAEQAANEYMSGVYTARLDCKFAPVISKNWIPFSDLKK